MDVQELARRRDAKIREARDVISGTPEQVAAALTPYIDLGADTLIVEGEAPFDRESVSLFMAGVAPELRRG